MNNVAILTSHFKEFMVDAGSRNEIKFTWNNENDTIYINRSNFKSASMHKNEFSILQKNGTTLLFQL
jgi:hypothetical protein